MEYVASVFDKLENVPHVVRVQCDSDDLTDVILAVYTKMIDHPVQLTRDEVEAQEELFADFVVISIFKEPGENLIPDLEQEGEDE